MLSTVFLSLSQNSVDQSKQTEKIHCQFCHPAHGRLMTLLKDTGQKFDKDVTILSALQKKTRISPVSSIQSPRCNDIVTIDLKVWDKNGVFILHLIYLATRLTKACVIRQN